MTTHLAASTVGWNWGRPDEDAMTAAAIDSEGGGHRPRARAADAGKMTRQGGHPRRTVQMVAPTERNEQFYLFFKAGSRLTRQTSCTRRGQTATMHCHCRVRVPLVDAAGRGSERNNGLGPSAAASLYVCPDWPRWNAAQAETIRLALSTRWRPKQAVRAPFRDLPLHCTF